MKWFLRLILVALLLAGGMVGAIASAHQESKPIALDSPTGLLAQFTTHPTGSGAVELIMSRFALPPGQASLALVTTGTTAIAPETGTLLLVTDRPVIGSPVSGDGTAGSSLPEIDPSTITDGTGGASGIAASLPANGDIHVIELTSGNAAIVEEGTSIRFVARDAHPVEIILITAGSPHASTAGA